MPPASLPNRALACDLYVLNWLRANATSNGLGESLDQNFKNLVLPPNSLRPPQILLVYWQREKQAQPGTYVAGLRDGPGRRCWQKTFSVH